MLHVLSRDGQRGALSLCVNRMERGAFPVTLDCGLLGARSQCGSEPRSLAACLTVRNRGIVRVLWLAFVLIKLTPEIILNPSPYLPNGRESLPALQTNSEIKRPRLVTKDVKLAFCHGRHSTRKRAVRDGYERDSPYFCESLRREEIKQLAETPLRPYQWRYKDFVKTAGSIFLLEPERTAENVHSDERRKRLVQQPGHPAQSGYSMCTVRRCKQ
jgi:hypothetical protein